MNHRLIVPAALILLSGCRQDSPEAQIQQAFDATLEAIEESDAGAAAAVLSPHFTGLEGMSRDEARLYLAGLLRQEKVGISVLASRIEATDNQGSQSVEVVLTARSGTGLLPQEASRRTYLLRWERLDGDWRLRSLQEP